MYQITLVLLQAIFQPLQGLFDAIVYGATDPTFTTNYKVINLFNFYIIFIYYIFIKYCEIYISNREYLRVLLQELNTPTFLKIILPKLNWISIIPTPATATTT